MHVLKIIMTALVLVSLLPWCGLTAAASATTIDAANDAYVEQETVVANEAKLTQAGFDVPSKKKRTAVLQQAQCNADAHPASGVHQLLFGIEDLQLDFGNSLLIARSAQAPPISPPRSI